jgi:quercetin dioxygenase-like cupin family protein
MCKENKARERIRNQLKGAEPEGESVFFILPWNVLRRANPASSQETSFRKLTKPPRHDILDGEFMEKSKKPPIGATRATDLIGYQDSSVVSRALIDKKSGTVTLFAFDEGQGLSEHTAPFDALVLILDGEAEITISGKMHHLNDGEMILMPANRPHALKAVKKFKMMLTMIKAQES